MSKFRLKIYRDKKSLKISKNPSLYKICFGCSSIVLSKVNICPDCHSYRFEKDELKVVDHSKKLLKIKELDLYFSNFN